MNTCEKWKDELLEAALAGKTPLELEQHLAGCSACAQELAALQNKREQMDQFLPEAVRDIGPSADFHARVLAAAEKSRQTRPRVRQWLLGALVPALIALVVVIVLGRRSRSNIPGLQDAQKLAAWRAPTDVLLETPGQEMLRNTPKLGESYVNLSMEESK